MEDDTKVYSVERYFQNKSFPIVRLKHPTKTNSFPYFCVIYIKEDKITNGSAAVHPHGNTTVDVDLLQKPYIRTSKNVLGQQSEMALSGKSAAEIYSTQIKQ